MGMYTGLRFKGIVKPEYRGMIADISDHGEWEEYMDEYPWLRTFAEKDRSIMIPRGALSYMPDSWEDNSISTAGFHRQFNQETGYWAFQCSLKNYDSEIQEFIETVVPIIMEETQHIEVLYEEWSGSVLYGLKEGKTVRIGEIKYRYDDETFDWVQGYTTLD
jgi:hypothetical protein